MNVILWIIAAVLVISVSAGTYVFYPEYFTVTYPLVRDTYLSWSMPVSAKWPASVLEALIGMRWPHRTAAHRSAELVGFQLEECSPGRELVPWRR